MQNHSCPAPPRIRTRRWRQRAARSLGWLGATALLAGCAGFPTAKSPPQPEPPRLAYERFGQPPAIPDFDTLLELSAPQREQFTQYFRSYGHRDRRAHHRLSDYLHSRLVDFEFVERTHDVRAALASNAGNCMSLALVTTALARAADLDVGWQLAQGQPVYSSEGSVIYSANHIQTRVYGVREPSSSLEVLNHRPYLLIDYFSDLPREDGIVLREHQFRALIYQNLGVEAMAEGRSGRAFWLLVEALRHDPENPDLYNALGVLHKRIGAGDTAEALYRYALARFGDNLLVLRNYRQLLLADGRETLAAALERRILALPDPDPFPLLELGDRAMAENRPGRALEYYRRARKVADYLDEIHSRIATAHLAMGAPEQAAKALMQARDAAWNRAGRERFQAKLDALRARPGDGPGH